MYGISKIITEKDAILISPKLAGEILQKQKDLEFNGSDITQRQIDDKRVKSYVDDMLNDKWVFTGDTIKLATNGRLLDGQHRLSAILQSGQGQKFVVILCNEEQNFKYMDVGKGRNLADILKISKISYYLKKATIITQIEATLRFAGGTGGTGGGALINPANGLAFYKRNTELVDYITGVMLKKYSKKLHTPNVSRILALFYGTKYQATAEEFIDAIFNDIIEVKGSNIHKLRDKMLYMDAKAKKANTRIDNRQYYKYFIIAIFKTVQLEKFNPNREYDFTIKQLFPERYEFLSNEFKITRGL